MLAVTGAMAVAEALYGVFSPAGKLTYTVMPKEFDKLSDFSSMNMSTPPGRTYKYYPTSPEYPPALWDFGHGLTYSSFNFSMVSAADGDASAPRSNVFSHSAEGSAQRYTVKIANTGAMDSDEVCLVFMVPPRRAGAPTPKRQLLDFVSLTNDPSRLLLVRCSLLVARCSLLVAPCSLLLAPCSLLLDLATYLSLATST